MEDKKFNKKQIYIAAVMVGAVIALLICFIATNTCLFSHKWREATCIAPKTCERCLKTEGEPLEHNFNDADCTNPQICTRCGKTEGEPLGHTITEWITDKEPNCTEKGSKHGQCTVCSETVTEEIPENGHTLGQWEIGTQATLTSAGERIQKCTVCGEIINKDPYQLTAEEKQAIKKAEEDAKKAEEKAKKEAEAAQEKAAQEALLRKFSISNTYTERSGGYINIYYKVTNNSSEDVSRLDLKCTLYDANGNALTSGNDYIYDLPSGQFEESDFLIKCSQPFSNYRITVDSVRVK